MDDQLRYQRRTETIDGRDVRGEDVTTPTVSSLQLEGKCYHIVCQYRSSYVTKAAAIFTDSSMEIMEITMISTKR